MDGVSKEKKEAGETQKQGSGCCSRGTPKAKGTDEPTRGSSELFSANVYTYKEPIEEPIMDTF